jgi:hypothetical protein
MSLDIAMCPQGTECCWLRITGHLSVLVTYLQLVVSILRDSIDFSPVPIASVTTAKALIRCNLGTPEAIH